MAVTVVFDFPHDSLEQYEKVFARGGRQIVEQPDRLHHQCYQNGQGFTVVDVWASEDSFARFGEVLGPILQQLGLDAMPKVHRTHRVVTQAGELVDY